jgi:tetratricopeptide (TPR) repeat protein
VLFRSNEYFTLVSESTLLDVPGLQPLRKDLLEAALRFYEKSSGSRTNDPSVLADTAIAHLRVGMIYFSLNLTDDSIGAIRKALDIVDRLRGEGPDAVGQLPRVAGFWRGLRWTQFLTFQPRDPVGAFTTLLRLEKTWSQLAQQFPTEIAFQSDLAPVRGLIGFAFAAAGRPKESEASHRKALATIKQLSRERPNVAQYRNDFLVGVRNMGPVLLANGNADESHALLHEAVQIGEDLVVEFPKNPNYRYQLSECYRVLGRQIGSIHPDQTVQHLRRAAELAQEIVREHPGIDTYYKAWGYAVSGWLEFSDQLGDAAQAEKALRESIRTQQLVAVYRHDDPSVSFSLAAKMLDLAQRVGKDPQRTSEADDLRRRALDTWDRTVAIFERQPAEFQHGEAQTLFADKLNDIAWTLTTTSEPALRDTARAVKLAKQAVELAPAQARYWNTMGMAHYRNDDWQSAIGAFGQAIALEPNNAWSFQRMRDLINDRAAEADQQALIEKAEAALANDPQYADWCAVRGRWAETRAGLQKRMESDPNDHYPWFQAAFVFAIQGDIEKYRRHCDEMLARFGSTQDPGVAERTAKACLILAPPEDQLRKSQELAERAVTTGSNHEVIRYYQFAHALADYRAGEFGKAKEWADKCLSSDKAMGGYGIAMAQLLGAMTDTRLGNEEQARAEWSQALQFCDRLPHLERGQLLYPSDWHDGIGVELLRREAERLINATLKTGAKATPDGRTSSIGAAMDPR